jgi:hypothetical protein
LLAAQQLVIGFMYYKTSSIKEKQGENELKEMRVGLLVLFVTSIIGIACPAAAYTIVSIDVTDSQDPVLAMTPYTYTIDYTFNTVGAGSATIIDQLPPEVSFNSATGGGIYDSATHSVRWDVPQTLGNSVSVMVIPDRLPFPACVVQHPPNVVIQNTATISFSTQLDTDTEFTAIAMPVPVCGPEFPTMAVPAIIGLLTCIISCAIRKYQP